jgi:hypothetical protein
MAFARTLAKEKWHPPPMFLSLLVNGCMTYLPTAAVAPNVH